MATNTAVKPSLTLKRRFNAPPAKVFSAWIEPEKIARWFGPPGSNVVESKFEARAGGQFMILAISATGEEFHVSGTVKEAVANERLVYSWAWRGTPDRVSQVTVDFKPDAGGTLLTLMHEQFFDKSARDRHNQGWEATLDKLEAFLAQPQHA
jgi:uncharacterized protein YndB with AHSA1/START domain